MKDALREKLEVFIRKYYVNRLIKGLIYGFGLGLAYFFVVAVAEYFGRFSSDTRFILLISLLVGLFAILGYYIVYPLTKLLNLGRRIGYDKAARLIGKHFPDVDDKILNTLQLQNLSTAQSDLLQASINQRIADLSPVPFTKAVDFGENRKYWPILVIPVLVFAGIFISGRWDVVSESGKRLAAYNEEFLPEAPFEFILNNSNLVFEQGQDVTFDLEFKGNSIPAEAEVLLPTGSGRMVKNKNGSFQFTVNNVQEGFDLRFGAAGFLSREFHVDVLPVPQINAFTLRVVPPSYTRIAPFETEAKLVQDIPEGSKVKWLLNLRQADNAYLVIDTVTARFSKEGVDNYSFEKVVNRNVDYTVKTSNTSLSKTNISGNRLKVIKDEFPSIKAQFTQDSSGVNVVYFSGNIADDYGLTNLYLRIRNGNEVRSKKLEINRFGLAQSIGGVISLDSLSEDNAQDIKLYLEVSDNDGVNGSKKTRTQEYSIRLMGREQRKEEISKEYDKYFRKSGENQKQLEEIQKALDKLRKELMDKKSLSFKEKSKLKDLLEKQQRLLERQSQNEKLLDKLQKKEDKLKEKSEEIKKEEERIDKIDVEKEKEVQELMKDIQKLMEKLDVQKLSEKLQELKKANEQNQKATERKDDLIKDLKFQKDLLEQAEKLEELAEKMEELSKKDDKKDMKGESEEKAKQEEVKKELEKVKEKVDEMKEENNAFKKASEDQKSQEKGEEASEEIKKAEESLDKNQQEKANERQKKAGEKMSEMSKALQNSMMQMQAKANELNMATLRQILENLEVLSFDVEGLSYSSKKVEKEDPLFRKLLTEQMRLKEGAKVIEDSLTALAKKVPEIQQDVFKELDLIKSNLDKSIEDLQELRSGQAAGHQQYVMTSANNLALMLDQSLRQMQQMAAQSKPGDQQCQKPGNKPGSKPGMAQIRKMQQGLGEKMDRMQQGQKKGDGKDGKKKGERGMSGEEVVKTVSEQEQLRQLLEELSKEEGQNGSKGNLQKAIDEMKELEREMLTGQLSPGYRERLREIESRLLESEKAEREQKKDEKRESESGKELDQLYQEELENYLKDRSDEKESLQLLPLDFLNYYRSESSKYLNRN